MMKITREDACKSPTHVIKCSKTSESAFVVSLTNKTYTKYSWCSDSEDDTERVNEVNDKLPDCEEIKTVITGKIGKRLANIYLCEKIISFEDEVLLDMPDAIFLQRVSPYTKTFDMVCFYGKDFEMISIVCKSDLDKVRTWYPNKIYSCGADPLPLSSVTKYLEKQNSDEMYDRLFKELTHEPDSSCSEYVASSSESDEDYISDEDDEIQPETSEEDSDCEEPPSKKVKL